MPHNCGDFALRSTRRVNLNSIVGTISSTYNGGLTSMNLHELFTLQILPDRNIMVQYIIYTNEYILKLQIHQHTLLTRKVISRHNLPAQVFFSVSSESSSSIRHLQSHLYLQVIFICKSSSSGSGSSLDLDHHH